MLDASELQNSEQALDSALQALITNISYNIT